ncbi:dimethylamine corrinoid protein 3 [Methanosarcinales archaeon]|nr:MAG: dimethylamine corrinoid protein 3 [Methanosarcinales archaeon]
MGKEELLKAVEEALVKLDEEGVMKACDDALAGGVEPLEIIEKALTNAMTTIGDLFEKGKMFLPQIMVAADIMKKATAKLEEKIPAEQKPEKLGTFVIGTVEGDVHDIGKGVVATLLKVNGFDVYDVGRDTPLQNFVDKAKEVNADIVGASALMTTTMVGQKELIELLKKEGLTCKTMIGGAAPTARWAEKIGADAYAENATEAVEVAKKLVGAE